MRIVHCAYRALFLMLSVALPLSLQSQQSNVVEKAPAWRYRPPAANSTDSLTPADIAIADDAFDFGFGAASPIDNPQTEKHYSSAHADVDSGDFPPNHQTEVIVAAHFTGWTVHLSKSHRSAYTIVNLEIDRVISDVNSRLSKGSVIPLGIPGGTLIFPGSGQVVSYEIARHSFPCEPSTQYLMFLSYRPQSLPFYEFEKAWKVEGNILIPTSHFDVDRASEGEKSHAGTSLDSAIREITSHQQ